MADIATLWHWPLADMCALTVPELMAWHKRALDRRPQDE
jgi:hypothetical protein